MSRAAPIASLLPPMQRKAAPVPRREAAAQGHLAAGSAPFPLAALRVNPVAQRNAALDAETEHDPAATPVQPRLEVGPTNDVYEQEADRIADTVQRMGQVSTRTMAGAGAAPLSVQPKCAACEAEDKVQRKGVAEAEAETGPPTLAAAPATLNAGGNQLAAPVRGFYEQRLGRDLSAVRVHQGAPAQALNESISARAFTYGSHIWLGAGEGAAPSRTLSHEMAHVLQQTQPRALGEEGGAAAAAAPALVQRLGGARWVPARSKLFTRSAGVSHDAVVKEISRANKDTLAEVPIPNAGRRPGGASGIRPTPGFADFFRASTNGDAIPGVKLVPGDSGTAPAVPTSLPGGGEEAPAETDTGKEAAPPAGEAGGAEESGSAAGAKIVNFNKTGLGGWGFTFGQKVLKGGSAHSVAGNQHPRVSGSRTTGGRLVGVDKAPIGIKLGELKPGHNVAQRLLGASNQLPRYQTGLSGIAAAVNAANARDGSWNMGQPGLMQADGDLKVPSKLSMTSTSTDFHRQLQLSARVGLKKLKSTTTVPGRLVFGRDPRPGHAGVWTYLWVPQNPTLAAGMGPTQDKQLRALVAELDKLVKELTAKPTKLAQPRRAGPARRARRQVRRTPHKDAFNAKAWEHERKTEFAPKVDALAAADLASPDGVQRGAAMQEAFAEIASELAGFTAPKLGSAATTELKSLHRLKRMAGPLGLLLGKLRTVFGGVFVKLADAWDGFKEKFAKRINRPRLAGATGQVGGWRLVVIRILTEAVTQAVKLLAHDIMRRFAACLEGMAERMLEKLAAELEQEFEGEIEAVRQKLEPVMKGFEDVHQRLADEVDPWFQRLDEIDTLLDDVNELRPYLDAIETTTRALILVAGCAEFGIGCIAGALGQLRVPQFIAAMADTDMFRQAVINPIVGKLVEPIGEAAYGELMDLLLGAPDATTLRGRIRAFADVTPACRMPGKGEMNVSSGLGKQFPAASTEAEKAKLIGEAYAEWSRENAEKLRGAVRKQLKNPQGDKVTGDQIDGLNQAAKDSGLTQEQLRDALNRTRGADGRVDLGKVQQEMERAAAGGPPLPEAPEGKQRMPALSIHKRITLPGPAPSGPRVRFGPAPVGGDQGMPAAPGGVIRVGF